ncbi:MAG: S9 family peptidase, partial [Candidatus Heimdallarchaeota archaeon]|nr:S9 family peptidase [Candidatus Heimdallarchaeota archaeon]MCK5048644.1 S9 family peptidase [Candidatus Heimdallarchaeota archaeon]
MTEKGKLPLKEFMSLPSYSLLNLSEDKKKVAFYWDKTGKIELYYMDLETKETKKISNGEIPRAPRTGFKWDRAGEKIIFGRDAGGNEQSDIWFIDLEGKSQPLTETPTAQEHVGNVSHDNEWLTFMSTRNQQLNVYKMKLDGSEVTQLTASDVPVTVGKWSPNDEWIVISTNEHPINLENDDIYLMKGDGSEMEMVIRAKEEGSHDHFSDWAPDGKSFVFFSDASGLNQIGIYTLESKKIKWLSDGKTEEVVGTYNPSGTVIAALENHEASIRPIIYNIATGEKTRLKIPPGMGYGLQFIDDERFILQYTSITSRNEVWIYNLADHTYEVLLEAEYGSIDKSVFVEPEYIKYKSTDGVEIPAIVYKPKNIKEGEKLPAIIDVHGGPTSQYFLSFDARGQYLASQGFVTIMPNIRGSTGYGVEFRDACIKDWGGKDLDDVTHGAKYLQSLPEVDPERIAVAGGSYGGFMTFVALTKAPEYWKAGFAWIGISDLFSMYEESMPHFKYTLNRQMGNPVEDKDLWYDRSAINFVENMTANILILHGV